jgi:hypothetical protein
MKDFNLPDFEHMSTLFEYTEKDRAEDEHNAKVKYTKKINGLVYEPKGKQPRLTDLVDDTKTDELIDQIMKSSLDDSEKAFLVKAACRHYVFNYENIAEYYCHASKECQELMEKSALVIIDFDAALENGYVDFSEKMKKLWFETWGTKDEA